MKIMTYSCRRFRAQSAFEFMFIFGIFLAALIIGTWVAWSKITEIEKQKISMEADELLTTVSEKLNTAWLEGEGFSTNITMPSMLSDFEYSIIVDSNYIFLTIGYDEYAKPIITQNVTGNFTKGAVNTITNMGEYLNVTKV